MDARIDAAAQSRRLYAAMDRLSEAERAVLELVAIDELTSPRRRLRPACDRCTARVRLHRARRKLRADLEAGGKPTKPKQGGPIVSQEQKPDPDFEQRLLARAEGGRRRARRGRGGQEAARPQAASPSWRRRGPRLALGAAIALGAVAVALIVSAGGDNTSGGLRGRTAGGWRGDDQGLQTERRLRPRTGFGGRWDQVPGDMAAGRDGLSGTSLHTLHSASSGGGTLAA